MISIIGSLNHQILTAQVTSLSLSRHLCLLMSTLKLKLSTFYQSVRRTTSACAYSYTISYMRLLSKLTPSIITKYAVVNDAISRLHSTIEEQRYQMVGSD